MYDTDELLEDVEGNEEGRNPVQNKLLRLLKKPLVYDSFINIKDLLSTHPIYLIEKIINDNHKYWSLLSVIKYRMQDKTLADRQVLLSLVLEIGHEKFTFDSDYNDSQNLKAFFFAAATGDLNTLYEIIEFYRSVEDIEVLHKTFHGDTVLSFMIKFGNLKQKDFISCFRLIVNELKIDYNRVDYYNENVMYVLNLEINKFADVEEADVLYEVRNILEKSVIECRYSLKQNIKHKLFNELVKNEKNVPNLLNYYLVDIDDGYNTLLHVAILKKRKKTVEQLLKLGANPNKIVVGGNEEHPLIFAFMLRRIGIFEHLLKNSKLIITADMVSKLNKKYLNSLLLNVDGPDLHSDIGHLLLYNAVKQSNSKAVNKLLHRGAQLTEDSLHDINPKDLENYFNSCIKSDSRDVSIDDYDYRLFIDFNSIFKHTKLNSGERMFQSEINILSKLSRYAWLKHLLEHPLMRLMMILKWKTIKKWYYFFTILKCLIYALHIVVFLYFLQYMYFVIYFQCIAYAIYTPFNFIGKFIIDAILIRKPFMESLRHSIEIAKWRLNSQFFVEMIIILFLVMSLFSIEIYDSLSSFLIILMSISILLTFGNHLSSAKWIAMIKKVFATSIKFLVYYFTIPIIGFGVAFYARSRSPPTNINSNNTLPIGFDNSTSNDLQPNFHSNVFMAIYRIFLLLSGDIGSEISFSETVSYVIFLLFSVGMVIIITNFWIGVAVYDIKEIEEQSIVVAFTNVIGYIQSIEEIYYYYIRFIRFLPQFQSIESKIRMQYRDQKQIECGLYLHVNRKFVFGKDADRFFTTLDMEEDLRRAFKNLKIMNTQEMLKELKNKVEKDVQNTLKGHTKRLEKMENVVLKRQTEKLEKIEENVNKMLNQLSKTYELISLQTSRSNINGRHFSI